MKRRVVAGLALALLAMLVSFARAEPVVLRILHFSDFHGHAEPTRDPQTGERVGGISYAATRIETLRRERPSLLLAAGDMIQGDAWANLSSGASVIELMNAMGFDALVIGNHELDFGQAVLEARIAQAGFPVLGANVEGVPSLKPYVILDRGGVRVAILGVVTDDTPEATHPRNVAGLRFFSPVATATRYVADLRSRADVVVVLSHLGHHADRALAEAVPGIDVIVGGHSHTRLDRPVVVGDAVLVQSWEYGKVIGVLDLTVAGGKVVQHEGWLEEVRPVPGREAPRVQAIVEKYAREVDTVLAGTVGRTTVDLDAEGVRVRETNFGNLVADAVRRASRADAAIVNGGAIRKSIPEGDLSIREVHSALPFDNSVVVIRLTGRELRQALEHGVSAVEWGAGRFPQVSGLELTYTRAAEPGARIRRIIIGGELVEPDREYRVATNDFLAAGGDGYAVFLRAANEGRMLYGDTGWWLRDLVVDHLRAVGTVAPAVEGRIRELDPGDREAAAQDR